jgi:ankyrin repeat protein
VNFFLSEIKSDANSKNCQYGMSPAHMAAIHGKFSVISLLKASGADLFQVDNEGQNILHKAVTFGDLDFLKSLLQDFKLHPLLVQGDHKHLRPGQFLQDLLNKGMHPKQLSRESEDDNLRSLLDFIMVKTSDYQSWDRKKYLFQLRLLLKSSLI